MSTQRISIAAIVLAIVFLTVTLSAIAGPGETYRGAKLVKLTGTVMVKFADSVIWNKAEEGMVLHQNDKIKTTDGASVTVIFDEDGSFGASSKDYVDMYEGTVMLLAKAVYNKETQDKTTRLDLEIGKIVANASTLRTKDSKFEVKTPTSIVGVRGTNYSVEYYPLK